MALILHFTLRGDYIILNRTSVNLTVKPGYNGYFMFDRVTQTVDRELFDYLLGLEVKKAVRYLYYFSLMVLQRDETVKDLPQHEEEMLIKRLASIVQEEIRGTDIIGRIGYDKFLILLDQADFQSSYKVGERIKDRIEKYSFKVDGHSLIMTTSIGIACFPTHANDLVTLKQKAETALNTARDGGGGRVCLPE